MNIGMTRRGLAGLMVLMVTGLLAACGGGSSSGTSQVRMLNATVGAASLDLYLTDAKLISGVANNAVSAYQPTGAATYIAKATLTGSTTAYGTSANPALAKDTAYTVVTWGSAGESVQTFYFPDNEVAPLIAGNAKIRLFNTSIDAGALDLYLTGPADDLTNLSPVASAISGGRFSSYSELASGTYRLRVTASGSKTDIRLDLPAVTLNAQDIMTFITQPSQGGTLVNGLELLQQGAATTAINSLPQARMRVVASVGSSGAITADVGGTALNVVNGTPVNSLSSPQIGDYVTVPSGTQIVTVNGNALANAQTLTIGGDYTLLVYGTLAAPQASLMADDNRLSVNGANAKLRLVNGLTNQGKLSMNFNFDAVASNLAAGSASAFSEVLGGAARIDVNSSTTASTLFSTVNTNLTIPAQSVYTMFMLDGGAGSTGYLLHRER